MDNASSVDPVEKDSLYGLLCFAFKKQMQNVAGQLPARVISYDRDSNIAQVQACIAVVTSEGGAVPRAPVASVPVLSLGGGGYTLRFPIKPGDTGWIEASDRDIALFMQAGTREITGPNTGRMHSFEDGRFIPDSFAKMATVAGDEEAAVLQNYNGTVRIALHEDKIVLSAPNIEIGDGDTLSLKLKAASIEYSGEITTEDGTFTINGIPFETHEHTNVQSGGDRSGPPVAGD